MATTAPSYGDNSDSGATAQMAAFSPLYSQIKTLILQSLQAGEWKPGEAIPSEMDLAARYRVSQGTVRKAIDELAAENLVVRRQGKGTFVATHTEHHVQYRFLRLLPDQGDLDAEGPAQRRIVECKKIRATADIARALSIKSGESVMFVRRVLALGGVPTIAEDIWLPASLFKNMTVEQLAAYKGSTYGLYEVEFGVRTVRAEEKLRAVAATEGMDDLLGVKPGTPLLAVERIAYTYNDKPVELRLGHYLTDTHHYRNELG
jgi:GntR family transcriptional regulator